MPPFIPQLTNPWFKDEPLLNYPVVAIGVNRVFLANGSLNGNLLSAGSVHRWLRLASTTHVMLVGCARDQLLENVWMNSRVNRSFEDLYQLGFGSLTAFNFSIYFDEPRMEHLVNLKRSTVSAVEAARVGLSAVPHVHWARTIDLVRTAEWLCQNPTVQAVAFNMQTYRTPKLWRRAIEGILFFNSLMNRPLTYILIGVSSYRRVSALSTLPKLCLVSARPYMGAQHYEASGSRDQVSRQSRALLFHDNVRRVLEQFKRPLLPTA